MPGIVAPGVCVQSERFTEMSFCIVAGGFLGNTSICSLHEIGAVFRMLERSTVKYLLICSVYRDTGLALPVFFSHVTNGPLAADYS